MKCFSLLVLLFTFAFAETKPVPVSPLDLEQCSKIVNDYYANWKSSEFKGMYSTLSSKGLGEVTEEKYVRQYKEYADWGCKTASFTINSSLPSESNVIVSVTVTFSKEVKPNLVNGTYSCHLSKTEGKWMIVSILSPVVIPSADNEPGDSHPGTI